MLFQCLSFTLKLCEEFLKFGAFLAGVVVFPPFFESLDHFCHYFPYIVCRLDDETVDV